MNCNKYFVVSSGNGKFGLSDMSANKVAIPSVFDEIKIAKECLLLKHDGKWGILPISDFEDMQRTELQSEISGSYHKNRFTQVNEKVSYYLFFDTETTGVPKNYKAPITDFDNWPRLVQLAWILCDENGNEISATDLIIRPDGFTIPIESSNVHRITTKIANEKGVDLDYALNRFVEDVKRVSCLVGHNISFDIHIVGAELLRRGNGFDLSSVPSVCTMLKTVNYCAVPSGFSYGEKYKWPKLQELHKKLFGYEFDDAHDAMADIRATKKCFFELKTRGVI